MLLPPCSETELLERAESIAGQTLGFLAKQCNVVVPKNLNTHKGWIGDLLETTLGANAGSQPQPDFVDLGIELKTIPVNIHGQPQESTYICVAPLLAPHGLCWENSLVQCKLQKVLWVPISAANNEPLTNRRIGRPFLWQPNQIQELALKQDWEELTESMILGGIESLSAKMGRYLQIRPKAAHSRVRAEALNEYGQTITTVPRGFYLRARFTQMIISQYFSLTAND